MKQFKRMLALVLALVMVLSLAACNGDDTPDATEPSSDATGETQGSEPVAQEFDPRTITEGVVLTIAVPDDDEVIDWNTNLTTLKIEEEFGVDLQFEAYASDSFGDKLNVMIQGGDALPDIIWGSGTKGLNSYVAKWSETGAILELSEYYANPDYAKYINLAIEHEGTNFVNTMKDADGNLWGMPKYYPNENDPTSRRLWINTEYAAALGYEELPTTTEGFFELCKAFVAAGDMNGNGLDDEVIFTGKSDVDEPWFEFLMSPFVYAHDDKCLDVENGELRFAFMTEEWKDGLKYIKQFFDEGLLDTTILTQDTSAQDAIRRNTEMVYLADFYYYPQFTFEDPVEKMEARLKYDYVCCLEGPSGKMEAYYGDNLAYVGAMITTDCENPEAAFIVMDYMMSQELGIMQRWGLEGEDWDWYDNVDNSKFIDGTYKEMYLSMGGVTPDFISYTNSVYWGTGTPQNKGYMLAGPGIQYSNGSGYPSAGGETEEQKVTAEFWDMYWNHCIPDMLSYKPEERIITLPMTAEENEAVGEIYEITKDYYMLAAANFITGVWDIDEYWDTYIAEMEDMGIDDLLAVYQTAYDRTK